MAATRSPTQRHHHSLGSSMKQVPVASSFNPFPQILRSSPAHTKLATSIPVVDYCTMRTAAYTPRQTTASTSGGCPTVHLGSSGYVGGLGQYGRLTIQVQTTPARKPGPNDRRLLLSTSPLRMWYYSFWSTLGDSRPIL